MTKYAIQRRCKEGAKKGEENMTGDHLIHQIFVSKWLQHTKQHTDTRTANVEGEESDDAEHLFLKMVGIVVLACLLYVPIIKFQSDAYTDVYSYSDAYSYKDADREAGLFALGP